MRPLLLDLNAEGVPLASNSVRVVTCFGLLAYLTLYDNTLSEAGRVLEDGGSLLLSMPNLGSYANRLSPVLGYQPYAVAISRHPQAGTIGRRPNSSANMRPLLHGAMLQHAGTPRRLRVRHRDGPGLRPRPPPSSNRRRVLSCFPSLSRRFLILARKRTASF